MKCVKEHHLEMRPTKMYISGIGGRQPTYGVVLADLCTKLEEYLEIEIELGVVAWIADDLPSAALENSTTGIIPEIELADVNYDVPGPVEAILGAAVCAKIFSQQITRLDRGLVAQSTELGWIIFGECAEEASLRCHVVQGISDIQLDQALQRLWLSDEPRAPAMNLTADEVWCEQYFKETCYRDPTGRYVTSMSIRPSSIELGESYNGAYQRFMSLERRLRSDAELREKYVAFMREYEALGHMQPAKGPVGDSNPHYFIPHHPVLKKFRVVFDASAKTTNGTSLNDLQLPGPKIQPELYDIVIRFRQFRIALSADVKKMFRQVRINPNQWDLQRILWRESSKAPLTEYCLTVITYGMTSAGYNAVKAMLTCAADNAGEYPLAAEIVPKCFYMDDLLTSVDSKELAQQAYSEVKGSLSKGGFELAKWASNDPSVILEKTSNEPVAVETDDDVSVLGLIWDPGTDTLRFKVKPYERTGPLTKRVVARQAALIFDPNGYITPATIQGKFFMQNLWRIGVGWDETLAPEFVVKWDTYCQSLIGIAEYQIPRWLGIQPGARAQIHAFCDASRRAYGAVLYVRTQLPDGTAKVTLLTSKSKLADLQTITIPRMELCGARMAAELVARCKEIMGFKDMEAYYWTDSEVVLHWLRKFPCELKMAVGNRVSDIQACSKIKNWRHVETRQNPADLISRGSSVQALQTSELWWNGPAFLKKPKACWPEWSKRDPTVEDWQVINSETKKEELSMTALLLTKIPEQSEPILLLDRFSSLAKAIRTTAYVMRFIAICRARCKGPAAAQVHFKRTKARDSEAAGKKKKNAPWMPAHWRRNSRQQPLAELVEQRKRVAALITLVDPVSVQEYKEALLYWIKYTQQLYYPQEMANIRRLIPVPKNSALLKLVPFIEEGTGIMRIRGRTDRASVEYDQRHPMILHKRSTLTQRLIAEAHCNTLHGGPQLCLQYLREKYWIPELKSAVKKYVYKCVTCTIHRHEMSKQLMADLPAARVTANRPFAHCGVDYAGPFKLKPLQNSRGNKTDISAYVSVFVCFASKAVHLELVGDLSSQAFLAALDRMILRKGHVEHLYSDQGRNFIGAANELDRVYDSWQSTDIINELTVKGIVWHFNTPLAPHHGGLWEAAVKSFKYHLYRVAGEKRLTYEALNTLLIRIEACLNSRPLITPSEESSDLTVITPGHLVSGTQMIKPLGPDAANLAKGSTIDWNEIRRIEDDLWRRWSDEYLVTLQTRNKWAVPEMNVKVNSLVILRDNDTPPGQWKKGRVLKVFPGPDGHVRSVLVKTAASEYERPITRICLLPVDTAFADCLDQTPTNPGETNTD